MSYQWSILRVRPGDQHENSYVDGNITGGTAREAFESALDDDVLLYDEDVNDVFLVVREDHTPGSDGTEQVTHEHRLFRVQSSPRAVEA